MHFFYSPNPERLGAVNIWEWDGTKQYLKHFDNLLYLNFVASNPRSSQREKAQARHEMTIAEKKLEFWTRHPKFVQEEAMKGVDRLKKQWSSGERSAA